MELQQERKFSLPVFSKRPDHMSHQEYKDYQKIFKNQLKGFKKGEMIHSSLENVIKHRSNGEMVEKLEGRTYIKKDE